MAGAIVLEDVVEIVRGDGDLQRTHARVTIRQREGNLALRRLVAGRNDSAGPGDVVVNVGIGERLSGARIYHADTVIERLRHIGIAAVLHVPGDRHLAARHR